MFLAFLLAAAAMLVPFVLFSEFLQRRHEQFWLQHTREMSRFRALLA